MAESPITLKNRELLQILEGLLALDGTPDKRYDFDGGLAWNIAKDRKLFEDAKRTFDLAVKTLAKSVGVVEGERLTEANAAKIAKFIEEREAIGEQEQTLNGVLRLSRRELQRAGVNIPGVLAALMPLLNDT
jgi:hypothetical protein